MNNSFHYITFVILISCLHKGLCTERSAASNSNPNQQNGNFKENAVLPDMRICGYQHSDDYFHTANTTYLSEFPWLALINTLNQVDLKNTFVCVGSLINARYVVTLAWCLNRPQITPVSVRLGEHHLINKTDCIEDSYIPECSDNVDEYEIEKLIPHPKYDDASKINNIGLIRLNKTVLYSDYIRPVCLAFPDVVKLDVGDKLTTSSWQHLQVFNDTYIKTRCIHNLAKSTKCQQMLSQFSTSLVIGQENFCMFEPKHTLECSLTYAGGPVLFSSKKSQWFLKALVIGRYGINDEEFALCTNVTHYIQWITKNLEP